MKFNIAKFFSGFAFWKGDIFGKLLHLIIVIALCLAAYNFITSRANESHQTAESITNITQIEKADDSFFLGLKIGGMKLGLRL